MASLSLDTFHLTCRHLDYKKPLQSLLEESRHGGIADKDRTHEDVAIKSHLLEQHAP